MLAGESHASKLHDVGFHFMILMLDKSTVTAVIYYSLVFQNHAGEEKSLQQVGAF